MGHHLVASPAPRATPAHRLLDHRHLRLPRLARLPRSRIRVHVSQPALERYAFHCIRLYSAVFTVFLSVVSMRCSQYAAPYRLPALMLAYSARRLELIALFENREYPSTDRRILGAFCAAAMGAQNAWTTRSSLKTSTVIVGTNLQKIAEILYLRVRRKLEGCCSSSVPELGRWEIWGDMGRYGEIWEAARAPSPSWAGGSRRSTTFSPRGRTRGRGRRPCCAACPPSSERCAAPLPSRGPRRTQGNPPPPPSPLSQAVAKHTDVRNQESALLTRLAFCCVAYAVGAVGGAEAARVCCIGSEATADEAASSRCRWPLYLLHRVAPAGGAAHRTRATAVEMTRAMEGPPKAGHCDTPRTGEGIGKHSLQPSR